MKDCKPEPTAASDCCHAPDANEQDRRRPPRLRVRKHQPKRDPAPKPNHPPQGKLLTLGMEKRFRTCEERRDTPVRKRW